MHSNLKSACVCYEKESALATTGSGFPCIGSHIRILAYNATTTILTPS